LGIAKERLLKEKMGWRERGEGEKGGREMKERERES
jgi:hypothetical protein